MRVTRPRRVHAGSSRPSCRATPARSTPCARAARSSTNFRSWPTFATAGRRGPAPSRAKTSRAGRFGVSVSPGARSARTAPCPRWRERPARRCRPARADGGGATAARPIRRRAGGAAAMRATSRSTRADGVVARRRRGGRRELRRQATRKPSARTARNSVRATGPGSGAPSGSNGTGTSVRMRASSRLARADPRARGAPRDSASAAIAGAASSSASSEPCVAIRSRAPFSPMPGTPLMLSMLSPISASTSTT